ncbi:MAG: hypothetical protein JNK48_27860 [Bryobacterales bacterium]|nr:hypothetical protein [Bryobacterales bacterium]
MRLPIVAGLFLSACLLSGAMHQDTEAYDLDRLREKFDIIRKSKGVYLNENILLNQVRKVGIGFDPSSADYDLLKKAGASDNFLNALRDLAKARAAEKAKSEPPPPPPQPKEGKLAVSCKPVDCEVTVDGKPAGTTQKGELVLGPFPEGALKVAVSRKDWDPDRDAHTSYIKDKETDKVEFTFKESRAALEALGQQFFDAMLKSLGGDAGIKEASRVRAAGARLISAREGKPQLQWSAVALFRLPNDAKFLVTNSGQQLQVVKTDAGFAYDKQPRQDGQEMEDAMREVYDRQFGRTLDLLRKAGAKNVSTKLIYDDGEARAFRVESGAGRYLVTLDGESCPREIKVESTGLMAGLRILYGDFVKAGNTRYPRETQVILPGAGTNGAGLRIEKVDIGPVAVKDKDLEGRKNWKPLGAR